MVYAANSSSKSDSKGKVCYYMSECLVQYPTITNLANQQVSAKKKKMLVTQQDTKMLILNDCDAKGNIKEMDLSTGKIVREFVEASENTATRIIDMNYESMLGGGGEVGDIWWEAKFSMRSAAVACTKWMRA